MFQNLTPRGSLPSLNALRAFEAMGRTGSATRAAAELNVTHSAISRQVKMLEAALGVRLFEGPRHGLRLTETGRALLEDLTAGFDILAAGVRRTRAQDEVRLAAHPSLAVKWLVPRLSRFEQAHPGIALTVSELEHTALRQRGADLALRFADADLLERPEVHVLAPNRIGLVCAPGLTAEIDTAPRLTTRTRPQAWREWAALTGRAPPPGPERMLSHLHVVIDAALAGLGVAVLPWAIVADEVAAGRLAAASPFMPDSGALVAISSGRALTRPERAVLRWLHEEASATG